MTKKELEKIGNHLVVLAQEAGKIILAASTSAALEFNAKKNSADVVTETDRAVEQYLSAILAQAYPNIGFFGEETYKPDVTLSNAPTFVVDPIDGTSNFVHGFPAVCTSIGLVIDKKPVIGVVYNPFTKELWSAIKGRGAFYQRADDVRQKLPLQGGPLLGMNTACIGIEWGSDREGPNFDLNLKVFTSLARTHGTGGKFVNSLRCTGSAAITICRVAAGQQEAFWECGSWAWDVAAAWCVLEEAGGIMVDGHPGSWSPAIDNRRYLAVRPATDGQKAFVEEFWSVIGDCRSSYGPRLTRSPED